MWLKKQKANCVFVTKIAADEKVNGKRPEVLHSACEEKKCKEWTANCNSKQ